MTPPAGPPPGRRAPAGRPVRPSSAGPARSGRVEASARLADRHSVGRHLAAASRRSRYRRRRAVAILVVLGIVAVIVLAVALPGSGPTKPPVTTPTTTTIPSSFGVGELTENWTDTGPGATTENFATGQTTAGRHLETDVFYPTLPAGGSGSAGSTSTSASSSSTTSSTTATSTTAGSTGTGGAGGSSTTVPLGAGAPVAGAPPASKYGPFPVILFAHGYDLSPTTYQVMLDSWVQAGFVVVAPIFPVDNTTNIKSLGGSVAASELAAGSPESDEFNEPNDVAFLVRQLASAASDSTSNLHGLIDVHRLVIAGQSDGANVVGALVYDQAFRTLYDGLPLHPVAIALLSGSMFSRANDSYSAPPDPPAELSSESTGDYCNPQSAAVSLYSKVTGTRWFLTIDGGSHLDPYTGAEPWTAPTEAATVAFFELETGWRSATLARADLQKAGNTPNVTSLVSGSAVPTVPSPPASNAPAPNVACGLPN